MQKEHEIVKAVYAAKEDNHAADELIGRYIPFIRAEASKFMGRICTQSDEEYSIAMIAFHEAILSYDRARGAFLKYAALVIRSRLTDAARKEKQHAALSLDEPVQDREKTMLEQIPDNRDRYEESQVREATRQEILELTRVLGQFGVSFADIADHSPKQERTKEVCIAAVTYAMEHRNLLEELLRTKKLPLAELVQGAGCDRKTLERHRKYVLAMLVIQTNGYEIIRGHLRQVWKKGGVSA